MDTRLMRQGENIPIGCAMYDVRRVSRDGPSYACPEDYLKTKPLWIYWHICERNMRCAKSANKVSMQSVVIGWVSTISLYMSGRSDALLYTSRPAWRRQPSTLRLACSAPSIGV